MIFSLEEIDFLEDYRNHSDQIWRQKDLSNQISFAHDWHSMVTPMFQSCSQRSCSPNPLRCLFPTRTVLGSVNTENEIASALINLSVQYLVNAARVTKSY